MFQLLGCCFVVFWGVCVVVRVLFGCCVSVVRVLFVVVRGVLCSC